MDETKSRMSDAGIVALYFARDERAVEISREKYGSWCMAAAEGILSYNADKAFFSCKALSMVKGLTDGNQEIANIKRIFPEAAGTVYLAVDHTKFDSVAFSGICGFERIDVVITDLRPSEEWLRFFAENEVRCVYPPD